MEVAALVAELRQLGENDTADEDLPRAEGISQGGALREDLSERTHHIEPLEDGIDAIVPAGLRLSQVAICVEEVAQLVEGLDQKELLLPLPEQLDALLVVADHHRGEDLVALALRSDLEVAAAFLLLLDAEVLGLYAELVVELPALLEGLHAVVGIPLDVLEQALGGLPVRVEDVLDDIEAEDLLLELLLVSVELLLLGWDLSGQHGLTAPLLLAGELPVLKLLHADLEGLPLLGCLSRCLLVEGALGIDDEG